MLPCLSVKDHCLIVGTVAETLIRNIAPCVLKALPTGAVTLTAAHDIGKLTPGFQTKCPKWSHLDTTLRNLHRDGLCSDHATMSQWHLQNCDKFKAEKNLQRWLVSTGGHHGSYRRGCKPLGLAPSEGGASGFAELRDELLDILIEQFGPLPSAPTEREDFRIHLLTGFTIFADWIGSNADWFPYYEPTNPKSLRTRAEAALVELKWAVQLRDRLSFGELFLKTGKVTKMQPRDIQTALLDAADAPGLYIVEAPMGMGKTEAALAAAYQRWTKGDERGLYFALPTQLTSNKIHERIHDFLKNALGTESAQALIHSNAWLSEDRNKSVAPRLGEPDAKQPENEHNDVNEPLRWFSSTRRQLLAPFGTGTIDQALLAVLPARFAALRYFALAGKVVVIDEVHSFDPYMSALIDRLVEHLIKAGGTVIILSATLTAARRAELVKAAGAIEPPAPDAYPLITKVSAGAQQAEHRTQSTCSGSQIVQLRHHTLRPENEDSIWREVAEKVEAGANVVVIRNSVALAQNTYRDLRSRLTERIPPENVGLLHSRFPQHERERNEGHWTERLGKHDSARSQGSLLVATQIVEQSVDIDADYLVTDLAPTELILQRIGRLHRHQRSRPAGFEQAVCHILHPYTDWKGDTKTVQAALEPHHWIYPPLALWQAAETLGTHESLTLPTDIRPLLEQATKMSPGAKSGCALNRFKEGSEYDRGNRQGSAKSSRIFSDPKADKEGVGTRYKIKPTAQLIILPAIPFEQGSAVTWQLPDGTTKRVRAGEFDYALAKELHRLATRIPYYLVEDQVKAAPDWLRQHIDSAVIATLPEGGTELKLYPDVSKTHSLHYREDIGVSYQKDEKLPEFTEPEDYWF